MHKRSYKIAIIGAGNVGTHLVKALEYAGHPVVEVYSRDLRNAKQLTLGSYNAKATNELDFSKSQAEVFLIAVKDDAIEEVVREIVLPERAIVAHTSGAKPLSVLQYLPNDRGVFYPVQTFSKHKKINFEQLPICIEGDSEATVQVLAELAKSLSSSVYIVNSEQRKALHVAAVFACNFSNHLIKIAKDIVVTEEMNFDILKPLIIETIDKALITSPEQSQTGPAVRRDTSTISTHLAFLKGNEELQTIYQVLTESIMETYE